MAVSIRHRRYRLECKGFGMSALTTKEAFLAAFAFRRRKDPSRDRQIDCGDVQAQPRECVLSVHRRCYGDASHGGRRQGVSL